MTTVSFQTDEELKEQASEIFESLGLNLTAALNMFLRQTVIQHKFPCSLEPVVAQDAKSTYGPGFFSLFGQGADLGFDEEPEDVPPEDVPLLGISSARTSFTR